MGEGFSVHTDELAQCGRRVSSMSGQAGSLRSRATAAEVPSRSWGLLGELTTHSKYADLQNQLTDHLSKMTTGLDNAGQRISNTADLYRETDEYHRKQLEGYKPDSGQQPPNRGGDGPPSGHGPSRGPGGTTDAPPPIVEHPSGKPAPESGPKVPDPGMTPDPSLTPGGHGKITVEVAGGGPVTVEVTGEAKEDVEVKGDIQQGGQTEHVDVHAQTDSAGHAKVALKDQYEHMSGTLPIAEDAR